MADKFPIAIRSTVPLSQTTEDRVRKKLAQRVGHAAPLVRRGTIRFEDINGPRGGVDKECRIKLVLTGRPSVQASDRGAAIGQAFDGASTKVATALSRVRGKHALTAKRPRSRASRPHAPTPVTITVAARTPSTRRARAASARPGTPSERRPMKTKTARRPPSRKAIKTKARRAKHRVGAQR